MILKTIVGGNMGSDGVVKYCNLMLELKQRILIVKGISDKKIDLGSFEVNVETAYLQFRKCLELIAFGSIVSNRQEYEASRAAYSRDWHADRILLAAEKVNHRFYPTPVVVERSDSPECDIVFRMMDSPFLTRVDFASLYDKCGDILHSANPYGEEYNYEKFFLDIPDWLAKIDNLLRCHEVNLLDDKKSLYLISMGEGDKHPSSILFQKTEI